MVDFSKRSACNIFTPEAKAVNWSFSARAINNRMIVLMTRSGEIDIRHGPGAKAVTVVDVDLRSPFGMSACSAVPLLPAVLNYLIARRPDAPE